MNIINLLGCEKCTPMVKYKGRILGGPKFGPLKILVPLTLPFIYNLVHLICISFLKKCANKRCKCCDHIYESSHIPLENRQEFHVKNSMNCESSNLLYIITCSGCQKQYIGETGDMVRNRIRVHRQQIWDKSTRMLKVSEHIDICGKGKFTVFPFYKFATDNVIFRREKEHYFINKFKPTLNSHIWI